MRQYFGLRFREALIKHRKSCQSSEIRIYFRFASEIKLYVRECMIAAEILGLISGYLRPIFFESRNFFNMIIALYFVLYLVLNSLAFILLFISLRLLPIFLHSIFNDSSQKCLILSARNALCIAHSTRTFFWQN